MQNNLFVGCLVNENTTNVDPGLLTGELVGVIH